MLRPTDNTNPQGESGRSPRLCRPLVAGGWLLSILIWGSTAGAIAADERPASRSSAPSRPGAVLSLQEQREARVVMQAWDYSCGAASLATLLNFQHGDPVSEREVALGLMSRPAYVENPLIVNLRRGFSLADLKIFVDDRGYRGRGIGRLEFADLLELAPAIVPIVVNDSSHFVVFRGRRHDRVLLADPLFGTRTMTVGQFLDAWPEQGEFGRVGFVVERQDGLPPPDRLEPMDHEFPTFG